MREILISKLKNLVIETLINIRKFPFILRRLKFYEVVHNSLETGIVKNKREIYYNSVHIFKNQNVVDSLIKETCLKLNCTQADLLISTTLKGIFHGTLTYYIKNVSTQLIGTSLIPDMNNIDKVECHYRKCLVIEKDTIFSKIVREYKKTDVLFVCGKGYPCRNTVSLIQKISHIKIFGIFDFDPYGLEICTKYLVVIKIGLDIEDIDLINRSYFLELTQNDKRKIITLQKKRLFEKEIEYMLKNNLKIELEGLFNSGKFDIVKYLDQKTYVSD